MTASNARPQGVHVFGGLEHRDARGSFRETFVAAEFRSLTGIEPAFTQDNVSRSHRNVLRGLHLQARAPQGKLVSCLQGSIFDVGVDLRPASATYRRWHGVWLDGVRCESIWWPPGFAHGFLAVGDDALVGYKVTTTRDEGSELVIRWNDPVLAIDWPLDGPVLLSPRDRDAPSLDSVLTQLNTFG